MKKRINKNAGFTLFEFLVIFFIVSLISSILIVNWNKNEKQYQVQRAAQEIIQEIRGAQDMALNSFKCSSCLNIVDYYATYFDITNPNSYIIFADQNGNGLYDAAGQDVIIKTVSIKPGTEINSIILSHPVNPLNPGQEANPSNPSGVLAFSLPHGFVEVRQPSSRSWLVVIVSKPGVVCGVGDLRYNNIGPDKDCKYIKIKDTGQMDII